MSGISGFYNPYMNFFKDEAYWINRIKSMNSSQCCNSNKINGFLMSETCGLGCVMMSEDDMEKNIFLLARGYENRKDISPIENIVRVCGYGQRKAAVLFEGWLTNNMKKKTDAQFVLEGYISEGIDFIKKLNGAYVFVIFDSLEGIYIVRDRIGAKNIYYTEKDNDLVFASKVSALFQHPLIKPVIDTNSMRSIFGVGPWKKPGTAVFRNVREVLPGHYIHGTDEGIDEIRYWEVESTNCCNLQDDIIEGIFQDVKEHAESYQCFNLDLCNIYKQGNKNCSVDRLMDIYEQAENINSFPTFLDVDGSIMYYCDNVENGKKLLFLYDDKTEGIFRVGTGDGSMKYEKLWLDDIDLRQSIFKDDVRQELNILRYAQNVYEQVMAQTPGLKGETYQEAAAREVSYLNLKLLLPVEFERIDRCVSERGKKAIWPWADYHLMEYMFNQPSQLKNYRLRFISEKTGIKNEVGHGEEAYYSPSYIAVLYKKFTEVLNSSSDPINDYIDRNKAVKLMQGEIQHTGRENIYKMTDVRLISYMLQVNNWIKKWT